MFNSLEMTTLSQYGIGAHNPLKERRQAGERFERALLHGRARAFLGKLAGRDSHLQALGHAGTHAAQRPPRRAGVTSIPLAQIIGSEGRVGDFDRSFHPLNDHTRDRWISIAVARRNGDSLPPVELIQVGDSYYVRDGHHRISVARAEGQREIEANVVYALAA